MYLSMSLLLLHLQPPKLQEAADRICCSLEALDPPSTCLVWVLLSSFAAISLTPPYRCADPLHVVEVGEARAKQLQSERTHLVSKS